MRPTTLPILTALWTTPQCLRNAVLTGGGPDVSESSASMAAASRARSRPRCWPRWKRTRAARRSITSTSSPAHRPAASLPSAWGWASPARTICDFYEREGPTIFPGTSLVQRVEGRLRQLFGPKHSHEVLRAALGKVLGKRRFGESKCRLVIPTYDAIGGRVFLMKTAHHERFRYDIEAPAVDVALATSAAPPTSPPRRFRTTRMPATLTAACGRTAR